MRFSTLFCASVTRARDATSTVQRRGSSISPSVTPSMASHFSTICDSTLFHRLRGERRREVLRIGEQRLHVLDELRADAGEIGRGRAGDDAVEVVGIALRFHQRLAAAVRAAVEVRARGRGAVVAADDRLRDLGDAVDRDVAEVQLALEIVERPAGTGDAGDVTGVGAGGGVTGVDRRQRLVVDVADKAAAAAHHELAVPVVGQEQPEANLLADAAFDAAVAHLDRRARHDWSRGSDGDIRELQRLDRGAIGRRRRQASHLRRGFGGQAERGLPCEQ